VPHFDFWPKRPRAPITHSMLPLFIRPYLLMCPLIKIEARADRRHKQKNRLSHTLRWLKFESVLPTHLTRVKEFCQKLVEQEIQDNISSRKILLSSAQRSQNSAEEVPKFAVIISNQCSYEHRHCQSYPSHLCIRASCSIPTSKMSKRLPQWEGQSRPRPILNFDISVSLTTHSLLHRRPPDPSKT
jgi:hypothetical protein